MITKVRQLRSLTLVVLIRTLKFVAESPTMTGNDPHRSIRSITRDMGVYEFLIRQVVP